MRRRLLGQVGNRGRASNDRRATGAPWLALALALAAALAMTAGCGERRGAGDAADRPATILMLGHVEHGKTTLTAAISKIVSQRGGGEFRHYDELIRPSVIRIHGIEVDAARVECRTDAAVYEIVDFRSHQDCERYLRAPEMQADGAILVVSAVDGPMPQTREQLTLAGQAGIEPLFVFVNKIDLSIDPELIQLVEIETRNLVQSAGYDPNRVPFIRGSARNALLGVADSTGRDAIESLVEAMEARLALAAVRRPEGDGR